VAYYKCKGCGKTIGSGCGCCRPDYPEEYGYCINCFPDSDIYLDRMQPLRQLLDRLDIVEKKLLKIFINEYDEDFYSNYISEINKT